MNELNIQERLEFIRRAERLKDTLRSSYTTNGRIESVADHTWRLALLAITFADLLPHVDLLRLLKICILHDLGEAIHGDIPAPSQVGRESKSAKERRDFETLITGLPEHIRSEFLCLLDDYESVHSNEARTAKALDKIETLIQHNQGSNPETFNYLFNLDYGRQYTDAIPIAAQIRALIDSDTLARLNDSKSRG
ncbi:MAG: HD domain-containing protein [Planctomycetaceae bacterium]|nr:HD domain-containing protein [Planctomycetaceae bacterium]